MTLRVLVIGGTGFLGQHIVARFAARGHDPVVLSRHAAPDVGSDGDGKGESSKSIVGDMRTLTVDELADMLAGFDAVVFAAGADAEHSTPGSAAEYFREGNTEPVRRMVAAARRAGVRHAVVCGSYYTAIGRMHPELRLADHHPYIASRFAQSAAALDEAGPEFSVAVLEIPFVFGATEGRSAAVVPMAPWLRSRWPLIALPGGTAVITVDAVAQAACRAVESAATGRFPLAEDNLAWRELFARLAAAAGRPEPVRVHTLPKAVLRAALVLVALRYRLGHLEPGFGLSRMADLLCCESYLDPAVCRDQLGVIPGDLERAFRETVAR